MNLAQTKFRGTQKDVIFISFLTVLEPGALWLTLCFLEMPSTRHVRTLIEWFRFRKARGRVMKAGILLLFFLFFLILNK